MITCSPESSSGRETPKAEASGSSRETSGRPRPVSHLEIVLSLTESLSASWDWVRRRQIGVIVPVPMYRVRERRRGYNQAAVFARRLGEELGLPVEEPVTRIRNTVPQKTLDDIGRKHNLKNAFHLGADIVKYKKVLLVDDIYTTGSTMDAVAQVLLSAGVKDIYYICISIGTGF